MRYYADLHIHSKYSRATSHDCDLENLAYWAAQKGIDVVGTGDFTHPVWRQELRDKLMPAAEPGLLRLRPEIENEVLRRLPPARRRSVRFALTVEISNIYKRGERTRKVHNLVLAPDFAAVDRIVAQLSRIGNLASDGRPILGLDSRDLLEIVLHASDDAFLVPAHVWTPWFSALGSKSGFDSVDECFADLSPHIFAIETGLSSDPAMNWRLSSLDRFRLISNSDAHSPRKLGREACAFDTELGFVAIRDALRTGKGFAGTVEFFPEEGKYHLDGHRKCDLRQDPAQTRTHGGLCPVCRKEVTVGVMHRVEALADRPVGARPAVVDSFRNLVPLPEVLGELLGVGPDTKTANRAYQHVIANVGAELDVLTELPIEDIARAGVPLLDEAVRRMRAGQVLAQAGYDGEYGTIRLFTPNELRRTVRAPLS